MRIETLDAIFRALNAARVRYLVAGGVAVNAHGYPRLTQDLDLALALDPANVRAALGALDELGYSPMVPVDAMAFADPDVRLSWVNDRNMEVFSLASDRHPTTTVDLFARDPFDFEEEYAEAFEARFAPDLPVRFVRLATLIAMKERLDRDRDRDDVQHLRWISEERARDRDE